MNNSTNNHKVWLIAVDMGYGHQRTAHPLRDIAYRGEVIRINNYVGIPSKDQKIWRLTQESYEFISRFRRIPFLGEMVFGIFDTFQRIVSFYPKRDLSPPTFSLKTIYSYIKKGWGRDLIERLKKHPLPIVTTFFTPAFMAEEFDYPSEIYCVICDADINRAWAPLNPSKSKIKYFVPNTWTRERLRLYGVKAENIFLTGYPLPKENIGSKKEIVKEDVKNRILNLDPRGRYRKLYLPLIKNYLGDLPLRSHHPLTIMFSIGGAGAQKEIALSIIQSLRRKLQSHQMRLFLAVGIKERVYEYFLRNIKSINLTTQIQIIYDQNIKEYFKKFNLALRETDILWTKPSELSFYAGLGIPIIIAPSLGSQEDFNRRWLLHIGAGRLQENPAYADQWLFDLLNSGQFAEMAMQGFVEIEKMGTYHIEDIILRKYQLKQK